ncbi:yghU [Symbiodinium sp. CCMP2592]|nr:yghU [Symbiodinium sp. CCMP2592]
MADPEREWVPPPRIEELYARTAGNQFAGINRPTSGPRYEADLVKGAAPLQLYSLATPNGWKVGILLEELGVSYDAHVVNIGAGQQFSSGFVGANPNSKIPALIDHSGPDGKAIAVMEAAAIMIYLVEKQGSDFYPEDARLRCECLQWLFWQTGGQGPMTGNFGHFKVYAPASEVDARNYGVARYGMEVQRICSVLDRHLAGYGDFTGNPGLRCQGPRQYLVGDTYSIADMACFPWAFMLWGKGYNRPGQPDAKDFLNVHQYAHLKAWVDRIAERPAVQRGIRVCAGSPKPWLKKETSKSRL